MRWPFRRQVPADASPVDAEAPVQASVAERRPEAWRELEPLRTIEPVELTADGRRFSEDLGVHHPVELALRPLGHDLALEAPQGIVSGIAHAVAAPDRGLELPLVPPPRPEAPPAPVVRARRPVQPAPAAPAPAPPSAPYVPPQAASTPVAEPEPSVVDSPVDAPSAPEPPLVTPAPARELASVPLPSARAGQSRGSELPLVPRPVQAVASAAPPAFASAPAPAPVAPASPPRVAVEQSSAPATSEQRPEAPVVLAAEVVEESELPPRTPESTHLPIVGLRHETTFETALPPVSTGDSPRTPPLADVQSDAQPVIRRPGLGAPIVRDPERASSDPATPLPPLARAEPAPSAPARPPAVARPAQREVAPPVRPVQRVRADEPSVVPAEPSVAERTPDHAPVAPPAAVSAPPSGERPDRLAPPARRGEAPLVGAEDIRQTDAPPVLANPSLAHGAETSSAFEPSIQPITRAVPAVTASPGAAKATAATTAPLTPAPATRPVQRAAASTSAAPSVSAPSTGPGRAFSAREPSRVPTPVDSRPGVPPAPAMPVRPLVGLHALAPERGDTADEQGSPSTPSPSDAPVVRRLAAVPDATSALTAPPAALPLAATAAAMGLPVVAAAASAPAMPWPAPMRAAPVPAAPLPEPPPPVPAAAPAPAHNGTSPARRAVQRAVQIPELQVNSTGGTPAAGSAPAQTPEQLREQVIRWIRAELLVNRERAGRLTDLR